MLKDLFETKEAGLSKEDQESLANQPSQIVVVDGFDIELYVQSMDGRCLGTVVNFLDWFKWDDRVKKALQFLIQKHSYHEHTVVSKERLVDPAPDMKPEPIEEPCEPNVIVGVCPKCGDRLRGAPLRSCETAATGRVFYKVCSGCTYYSELFKNLKTNELREIEGE
jgi:hypothetical protein